MLQSIYDQMTDFYDSIEEEYATFFDNSWEWEHFHFKFLIYYLVRYSIGCRRDFIVYHYRVAYRLYTARVNSRTNLLFYGTIMINSCKFFYNIF